MNCKQAEELLPLYAGRELEEKRATLVTEHLQTCAACARVADEYRESVQLTEKFAPPVFSEAVYAGIRQRVMREIEAEAMAPAWSQTIANFFRPRLTWAIAGALLVAVSLFAIYFIVNTENDGPQLADKPSQKVQPGANEYSNSEPQHDKRDDLPPLVNAGGKEQQLAGVPQPQRKRPRNTLVDRTTTVDAKSREAMSTANNASPEASSLPEPMVFPHRDSADLGKTLRVELQTNDPNIRIIWFTQQETKPRIPSSKGT
jgi:Putative zinc-finger